MDHMSLKVKHGKEKYIVNSEYNYKSMEEELKGNRKMEGILKGLFFVVILLKQKHVSIC